jgi:large conductance mechanosensitive channel
MPDLIRHPEGLEGTGFRLEFIPMKIEAGMTILIEGVIYKQTLISKRTIQILTLEEEPAMLKEFKEFAMKGNVIDMAVGIIIGAAFGTIVNSLVQDVIMPPIGLLLGNVDFTNIFAVLKEGKVAGPYASVAAAKSAGAVTINFGVFINTIISFILIAFAVFLLVRTINRMRREEEAPPVAPATKECAYCFSAIPIKATRCPNCTSELKAG